MPAVLFEAAPLISQYQLGGQEKVYKPHTIGSIIAGLFIIVFAIAWIVFSAALTQSPLVPASLLPFQFPTDPLPNDTIFTVLGIIFPLFGLIFIAGGIWNIIKAARNSNVRAILCTYGVVSLGRTQADAFRWEQVATVFHKVTEHTSTHRNQSTGLSSTSTTYRHSYTVNCLDGRSFVFDNVLGGVRQLGGRIEYEVARTQKRPGPYTR